MCIRDSPITGGIGTTIFYLIGAILVIGAGAGLSTSAGLTYSGERFNRYFYDFAEWFGIRDIYSGGFYPFPDDETRWAWWARHIYFNRYIDAPKPCLLYTSRCV